MQCRFRESYPDIRIPQDGQTGASLLKTLYVSSASSFCTVYFFIIIIGGSEEVDGAATQHRIHARIIEKGASRMDVGRLLDA